MTKQPVHPAVATGFTLLTIGALVALWFNDWHYAAAGLAALLISAVWAGVRPQ